VNKDEIEATRMFTPQQKLTDRGSKVCWITNLDHHRLAYALLSKAVIEFLNSVSDKGKPTERLGRKASGLTSEPLAPATNLRIR
jgi:hypothetical protein